MNQGDNPSAAPVEPDASLYQALITHSFEGIAVLDAQGCLRFVSPSHQRLLGFGPAELLGQSLSELVHPDDRGKLELIWEHLLRESGNVIRLQWRQRHRKGAWRWLEGLGVNLLHVDAIAGVVLNFQDVTERRLQDEALRLSEARLRRIIDLIPAAIYARDFEGRTILANDWATRHGIEVASHLDREVILSGEMCTLPQQILHPDGSRQILRTYKIPYLSPDSGHPAALTMAMDITELKQAEDALRKSMAHLHTILETTDTSYVLLNQHGEILTFNRQAQTAMRQQLGRELALGAAMLDYVSPERRPVVETMFAQVLQGQSFRYEKRFGKTEVWFDVRILPIDHQHEVFGICMAVSEITARKRQEISLQANQFHYEMSQRISRVGSWEMDLLRTDDLDGNPLRWTAECFRIFGYAPGAVEVSNRLFFAHVHPDDRAAIVAAIDQTLKTGEIYSIEHRIVTADGRERIVFERAELLCDAQTGTGIKLLGTVHDLTEFRSRLQTDV